MKKLKNGALILALLLLVSLLAAGCNQVTIQEVPTQEEYTYVNPDETKAETDAGFVIDGILDEEAYQNNNWLYLSNKEGGTDVQIAATSYFGEKGMYFVFDVTEGNPIYVNLDRASYLNSGIELHLAPSKLSNMKGNSVFEINLLPSGDMTFKKSNGKGEFVNVATTNDIMAVLGTTTKGGELNTEDCYGYIMELFIPWGYMEKFDLDTASMKEGYVYTGLAHITSFNYTGTNMNVDRYWYSFDQQHGASWSNVYQYFRFDGNGAQGTVPVTLVAGDHYTIAGAPAAIPGMELDVTVTPEAGYALTSILVNGKEYIKQADFGQDGSVTVKMRAEAGGVTVSASAEAITEGNKTLTGTVIANKLGGGSLKGILASYKGPTGEKLLELDTNGKFTLADLKPGYYTILLEKKGYAKLSREIYVNRDMEVELLLEYDLFASTGYGWVLDEQNSGVLYKFGGQGELLTNDSYGAFTVSATFKFDTALENIGTAAVFTEQRQGFKIAFSNGKIWHVDLLKQNGTYCVQYAKHSGENAMTGWKTIHTFNAAQIAKYTSQQGIQLSIQRSGRYANIYLDGVLVGIEVLDADYAGYTAQVGFESWAANREIKAIPYNITPYTSVNLYNTVFKMSSGWDVSQQYNGLVVKTENGVKRLTFIDKYVNMDLTVTARDYQNSTDKEGVYPRTDILFEFDNGKQMSFGITTNGTTAHIQSIYDAAAADKYINNGWQSWGNLTDEEVAQFQNSGVKFRVVRYGTEVSLYIGSRLVAVADLSANNSGVTAYTAAKVNIRHFDDAGVRVEIPFHITEKFDLVKVTVGDNLSAEKKQYFVGDTVKVMAKDGGSYISALKINGEDANVHWDGTCSFVATEKVYSVTGEVAKGIFKPDAQWNILQQNMGIISIPERTGEYASLYTFDNIYRDAAVTVRDYGEGTFQMQIRFLFDNGKQYQVRLDNDAGFYRIQQMGGGACITGWKELTKLTDAQVQKLKSEAGIQYRIALVGTCVKAYLDGTEVASVDLADAGITADTIAQVRFMMYGNKNVKDIDIPYTLGGEPAAAIVQVENGIKNGTVTAGKTDFIVGETVTVIATPAEGYYLKSLSVTKDGQSVDIGTVKLSGGSYSFVAENGIYNVEASFGLAIFQENAQWDLTKQDEGIVSIPKRTEEYISLFTLENTYREAAITARDVLQDGNFQMQIRFLFTNGKKYQVRLYYNTSSNEYQIQNMDGITTWGWIQNLDAEQIAKLTGDEGVEFRAKIVGSMVELYVDGKPMAYWSTERHDLSSGGVTADTTAQIQFVTYGNIGVENIELAYALVEGQPTAEIQLPNSVANGTLTADKTLCVSGETVTVTATPAEGYYLKNLSVTKDGQSVDIGTVKLSGGSYSFVAENGIYNVEASFGLAIFQENAQWDLTKQDEGIVSIPKRTEEYISLFTLENTYREAAITARDVLQDGNFQMQIRFLFTNGKKYQVRLYYNTSSNEYQIQNMDGITTWGWIQNLDAEQIAKLTGDEGVEFRAKIVGSMVELYVDGKPMAYWSTERHDLSSGGVTADTTAQIQFVTYGNIGVENIELAYALVEGQPTAEIQLPNSVANGTLTADKTLCVSGETVTVTATPAEGYYLKNLSVTKDGQSVDIGTVKLSGGSYSFVAENGIYNVEASFGLAIFQENAQWDLTKQDEGIVSIPKRTEEYISLFTLENTYREAAITARDVLQDGNFQMQIRFLFTNGKKYQVRLYYNTSSNEYQIQNMDGITTWGWIQNLDAEQIAKLTGDEGVEFRAKIVGSMVELYVDGKPMAYWSTERHDLSSGGVTADTTAQIQFVTYGNIGVENIELAYALVEGQPTAEIQLPNSVANGTLTADKTLCAAGETVTITATPDSGYNLKSLTVTKDGTPVDIGQLSLTGGTYSFVAQSGQYTVQVEFAKPVFGSTDTDNSWDLSNQYNGSVILLGKGAAGAFVKTEANTYREAAVTVRDVAQSGTFEMQIRFYFTNGNKYQVRVYFNAGANNGAGQYEMQTMDGIVNWKWIKNLNAAQTEKVKGEGVEFRVKLVGTKVELYLDNELMAHSDAARHDLSSGIDATTTAQIQFHMVGNSGAENMKLKFQLR